MTLLFLVLDAIVAIIVTLATTIQVLYLESLRIRARELPSLEFFKSTLETKIGLETELGALTFSLVKHLGLAVIGCLTLALTAQNAGDWEALIVAVLLVSFFAILGTYMIPQVIYRKTTGQGLLPLVPLFRVMALLMRPLTWALNFLQSVFDLGDHPQADEAPTPEEHIDALIAAGEEEGIIEKGDRELIQSVVAFGDTTVREVMTPRPRIVAIRQDASLEELREVVIHEQYSRIPVYEAGIDHIIGFVHVRDMFELDEDERQGRTVRELLRPIRFVPETKPVNDLIKEMQQDRAHMAIVVDEYGNTAGLVTLEDLVEEVFGEIQDEHEPVEDVVEDGPGRYVVSGNFSLDRLQELLDFRPAEEPESTTAGGLVSEWLGHVPRPGEFVEREGIRIEVLKSNDLRVEQVRVSKVEEQTTHA